MTSNVYMVNFRSRKIRDNKISKIRKLMDMEEFKGKIRKKNLTAVKIHFGERGNDTFIQSVFVRQVVDKMGLIITAAITS